MTDDLSALDTLRPEVREAVAAIDKGNGVFVNGDDCEGGIAWATVRAELLRLASLEKQLRDAYAKQHEASQGWVQRATDAEAELAALKARIEKATIGTLGVCFNGHEPAFVGFPDRFEHDSGQDLIGCRVALVKVDNELTGEHADSMEEWARRKVEE